MLRVPLESEKHLMPRTIPDEWLSEAGISADDARIEFACRLYDGGRLSFSQAIRWSGRELIDTMKAIRDTVTAQRAFHWPRKLMGTAAHS